MRSKGVMTPFTTRTTRSIDPDIEARIATWAAGLGVTILAIEQTVWERRCQPFGSGAVIGRREEAAIQRVGN
jgi:hypothetical protein